MRAPRVTLLQVFAGSAAALALLLGALLALFSAATRRSVLHTAEALRASAARRIEAMVREELDGAARAVRDVEQSIRLGVAEPDSAASIESALFAEVVRNPRLAEVTFTRAERDGFDPGGEPSLGPGRRCQVSVVRTDAGALVTRIIWPDGHGFALHVRERAEGGGLLSAPLRRQGPTPDPTEHLTFRTAASRDWDGVPIWTDLSYAQSDSGLPPARRRVVVSVQKSMVDGHGRFAGVVRAGLLTHAIDAITALRVDDRVANDPHRIFLADPAGHLVTRTDPVDPLEDIGDALRVSPRQLPEPLAAALASPVLKQAAEDGEERSSELSVGGERWLATFRPLQGTQDWLVGIAVPESAYTGELHELRIRFLVAALAVVALIAAGGGATLLALRRSLGRIGARAARMRQLDFTAAPAEAPFRDVQEVVEGLERAKTALRALGKYVPIDLVRQLYRANAEPALGGELRELTILFTDLEGFTGLSERLSPDELARALGAYLEAMTGAIRECNGTVDKFIGDAVMAFWNAPEERAGHARQACASVLACQRAVKHLYASPSWTVPPLRTRFGLHTGQAMVGHFGAPERFNYTALGDSVNLASRLEGLCKQYGVEVLVSEAVVERAREEFAFRLVDRVAVKGRSQGILVYQLVGPISAELPPAARDYETAFASYSRRDFAAAAVLLERHPGDGPSRVLLDRCRSLSAAPPPPGWNGVHVAATK
ncbi:MAG TPA: adenylate/guanylate cyclase domain-containing protein [Myxococcales bacterium]|nr:adenylate/guanylate cyclase domain-containing protein [Myxococcales bacterium]